jgi:diguanylate cyclase (GGDEF)-like protein
MKSKFPKGLIASIPPELKEQFVNLQLKNSIQRIRILTVFLLLIQIINIIFFRNSNYEYLQNYVLITFADYAEFAVIVIFNLTVFFLSKKRKKRILWIVCYLFIAFHLILYVFGMLESVEYVSVPYVFFMFFYLSIILPDFKPKIYIPFAILYILLTTGILLYKNLFTGLLNPLIYIYHIFAVILITKISFYNSKVRTFVNTHKINELIKDLSSTNKELSLANVKLQSLSTTDELTKLDNRRSFMEYMNMTWKQNMRLNLPVTVLMIDVDYFKKYNDSLGHLKGDKALIAIAQFMKGQMKRETDFIARFGGEEFVCLLLFLEKSEALHFAEKLVQSVENMKLPHPTSETSKYVTISAGIATIIPDNNISQSQLLDEADKALYKAKQSGRNRAVAA